MPNLRPSATQQVIRELEASRFGLVGFDVKFPDGNDLLATIVFLARKDLSLVIGMSGSNRVHVRCSPGEYKTEDYQAFGSFDECVACIQPWARRIYDDLRIRPVDMNELDTFRQSLDAHLKENVPNESARFTDTEIADLGGKLAALEERLQEMEAKHVLTEKELKELRQVLGDARKDLPTLSKGLWYRTAGGKVWEVMKKTASTAEGRQLLAEAAKKMLGLDK
jgi:hypothetical protein